MKNWNERPFEIKNLFNPAFCGVVLLRSFQGFEEIDDSGMPFSLALLVLPICLNKDSRNLISNNPESYLLKIISNNPQIRVGFAKRAEYLLPYTFEALGFTMHLSSFYVNSKGSLKLNKKGIRKKIDGTEESIEIQKVAKLIGKNFAQIGDRVTIYTSFGIKP